VIEVEVKCFIEKIEYINVSVGIVPLIPDPLAYDIVIALFNEGIVVRLSTPTPRLGNLRPRTLIEEIEVKELTP
jgi:hypothetical protein